VAEAEVFDVVDGLVEQVGDVRVVEGVDDAAAASFADYEAEVPKDAQLLGDGGPFHPDGIRQFANGAR
jgi:hypothetical protein